MDHTPEFTQPQLYFDKLCECGCGLPAPISKVTRKERGQVRGQPNRFVRGHNAFQPLQERFWKKVNKRGPNDCWLWTGSRDKNGYGYLDIGGKGENAKKKISAHRLSYELHYGPVPDNGSYHGTCVCHNCPNGDQPACCNPAHLWPGTQADNFHDMLVKKRRDYGSVSGESSHFAKLTEEQVRNIRQRRANGETGVVLAKEFGVTTAQISAIFTRKIWRHVE